MEPEVRFQRIESLLHAMAERENQMEIRFNQRMDRAEQRMDRAEQRMDRAEQRMDRAEAKAEKRMQLFDTRLEATRKLVVAGIKMVTDIAQRQKKNDAAIRRLAETQQAYFDWRRRGNGNGRH